jgi:Uma2 family endonuclease
MSAIAPELVTTDWSEHILLEGISWETYERLRDEADSETAGLVFMTYDEGTLEIMSPSPQHEDAKKMIAMMIEIIALEFDIPMSSLGNVTIRRKRLAKGLEPDECYYIKGELLVRNAPQVDKNNVPTPDLVVEREVSRRSIGRRPMYARMGVPELWVYDGLSLLCLQLSRNGEYEPAERSICFPFLRVSELEQFIAMSRIEGQTAARRAFRDWIKQFADQERQS